MSKAKPVKKRGRPLTDAYFRRVWITWVKRLHLRHWQWEINLHAHLDDAFAQVTPHQHYDQATVEFRADWSTWDKRALNETVVHELLHVAMRDIDHVMHLPCEMDLWKKQGSQAYHDAMEHATEGFIQRMAETLCDAFGIVE